MTTIGATEGNIIATIIVTHTPRNSGKVIDAAGPASAIPMLSAWPIPGPRLEVIESAPEVRSMTSQARAAKLSRTINTTAADVRSAPTGQSPRPVPEAGPCVTADLPEVRRNLHAPRVSLSSRGRDAGADPLSTTPRGPSRQGVHTSWGAPVPGGVPRP